MNKIYEIPCSYTCSNGFDTLYLVHIKHAICPTRKNYRKSASRLILQSLGGEFRIFVYIDFGGRNPTPKFFEVF